MIATPIVPLCQRCHTQPASQTTAGLPMCALCSQQVQYKNRHVAGVDLSVLNPLELGERAGKALTSDTPGGLASTVKQTASTVKTVAIVGGVVTGLLLLYVVWKQTEAAKETSHTAMRLFAEHPEALAAL